MPDYLGRRQLGDGPIGDAPGAYGPPDPDEYHDLRMCRCGIEYVRGGWQVAHGFEPCPAARRPAVPSRPRE